MLEYIQHLGNTWNLYTLSKVQQTPCALIQSETGGITIVAVYVDDLIIIAKTAEKMEKVKRNLATRFRMKDLGKLHYCLGINIEQDEENKCLCLHQKQYIQGMLEKYGLSEAKIVATPADVNVYLKKEDESAKQLILFGINRWLEAYCMHLLQQGRILLKQWEQCSNSIQIQMKHI